MGVAYLRYYPKICSEELKKKKQEKNCQILRSPGLDTNPESPKCKAGLLATTSLGYEGNCTEILFFLLRILGIMYMQDHKTGSIAYFKVLIRYSSVGTKV